MKAPQKLAKSMEAVGMIKRGKKNNNHKRQVDGRIEDDRGSDPNGNEIPQLPLTMPSADNGKLVRTSRHRAYYQNKARCPAEIKQTSEVCGRIKHELGQQDRFQIRSRRFTGKQMTNGQAAGASKKNWSFSTTDQYDPATCSRIKKHQAGRGRIREDCSQQDLLPIGSRTCTGKKIAG